MVESMQADAVRFVAEIVDQVLASTPSNESGEDFDLCGLLHLIYFSMESRSDVPPPLYILKNCRSKLKDLF
jgi:hypothetical protein